MTKYIVIHPYKKRSLKAMIDFPPEKNVLFKNLKSNCTSDADWLSSWAVPEQEKLYCEWNAKDPDSIRKVFEKLGGTTPIERIDEMHIIEANDFK